MMVCKGILGLHPSPIPHEEGMVRSHSEGVGHRGLVGEEPEDDISCKWPDTYLLLLKKEAMGEGLFCFSTE